MNNNRTSEKWTSEKTKLLISEYKKHPCLYKTELAEYRDKSLKVEALQEMAIKIGTTSKINCLCTNFLCTSFAFNIAVCFAAYFSPQDHLR